MPVKGKEEHNREMAELAAATTPADLAPYELPEAFSEADRVAFAKGVTAFKAGDFYLAHDLWEEVWQSYRAQDRLFLQGLIHVAVGCYHAQCVNHRGAASQLGKAIAKITPFRPRHWGIDADDMLELLGCLRSEQVGTSGFGEHVQALQNGL
jgi:predicted metal-dependent hydrolase